MIMILNLYFDAVNMCVINTFKCLILFVIGLVHFGMSSLEDRSHTTVQLEELMNWIDEQVDNGNVPRFSDVVNYAHSELDWTHLKPGRIAARLRLHPNYLLNSPQQRGRHRAGRHRPISINSLGHLHCDIGYFPITRLYETPLTYRSGFLVGRDVLSRYVYAVILRKSKSSKALMAAFRSMLQMHRRVFGEAGHRIKSVSFDQERSVLSRDVQDFLKDNSISFHAFKFSASKAKVAENTIKQIRTTMARLIATKSDKRWWIHLEQAVETLNDRPLVIGGQRFNFKPKDIDNKNLNQFLRQLHNKVPYYYWAQYDVSPDLVNFKYEIGALVRPKLIVTSSAVIGVKRSEENLEEDIFVVSKQVAYITASYHINKAYLCQRLANTENTEVFDEDDLARTINNRGI